MNKEIAKCDCYKERIERHYFNDFERGWNVSHGIYDKYENRVISYCSESIDFFAACVIRELGETKTETESGADPSGDN